MKKIVGLLVCALYVSIVFAGDDDEPIKPNTDEIKLHTMIVQKELEENIINFINEHPNLYVNSSFHADKNKFYNNEFYLKPLLMIAAEHSMLK